MAELVAFLPAAAGRILDVCGGNDGVLDFLLERFSSAEVAAVIDDRSLRADALKRVAEASVLKRSQLAGRPLTAAFDCAVWVDGLSPRAVSLAKLLRQSASALKPGGTLVAFETLRRRRPAVGPTLLRGTGYASSVHELRRQVHEAGLLEPTLVEATAPCLTAFRENLSRFATLLACTGEAPEASIESVESQLCGTSHEIVGCLFVVAKKPGDAREDLQISQRWGE
jgi:SAM-dependent methyltransferase